MTAPTTLDQDRYQLEGMLGEGGMAQVFRARDTHLGVTRAIKMLSPTMVGKSRAEKRFLTEARTMARLEHPHIVRVLDVRREGELPYMVMELVAGGSLSDLLHRSGSLSPVRALGIMEQVLSAIGHAHAQGVVHRDIKPGNILLDEDGNCRVTDFGIARVREQDASHLTRTGAVMGTWGYMAPEQRRDAKNIDQRADVYSLGALLFALVTGQAPMELFAAATVSGLLDAVPAPLVPVIKKACAFDPAERYGSCAELQQALLQVAPQLGLGGSPPPRRAFVPQPQAGLTRLTYMQAPADHAAEPPSDPPGEAPRRRPGPIVWFLGSVVAVAAAVLLVTPRESSEQATPIAEVVEALPDAPPVEAPATAAEGTVEAIEPADQAVRGLAVTTPRIRRQPTARSEEETDVAPGADKPEATAAPSATLEPAQRLARFTDGTDWRQALVTGNGVDAAMAVELSRVIGLDYDVEEDALRAKGMRAPLIHLLNGNPGAGVAFVGALGDAGELSGFLAHAAKGQGGDFSDPILRAMGKHAPRQVKAPSNRQDCRELVLYVDMLHRPEDPGGSPDWIEAACSACTELNDGEPVGKCDA